MPEAKRIDEFSKAQGDTQQHMPKIDVGGKESFAPQQPQSANPYENTNTQVYNVTVQQQIPTQQSFQPQYNYQSPQQNIVRPPNNAQYLQQLQSQPQIVPQQLSSQYLQPQNMPAGHQQQQQPLLSQPQINTQQLPVQLPAQQLPTQQISALQLQPQNPYQMQQTQSQAPFQQVMPQQSSAQQISPQVTYHQLHQQPNLAYQQQQLQPQSQVNFQLQPQIGGGQYLSQHTLQPQVQQQLQAQNTYQQQQMPAQQQVNSQELQPQYLQPSAVQPELAAHQLQSQQFNAQQTHQFNANVASIPNIPLMPEHSSQPLVTQSLPYMVETNQNSPAQEQVYIPTNQNWQSAAGDQQHTQNVMPQQTQNTATLPLQHINTDYEAASTADTTSKPSSNDQPAKYQYYDRY